MVHFVSVLAALFALSAYATPKVGDYASFDLTVTTDGQTAQGLLEQELLQGDGAQFLERQTVTIAGRPAEVNDTWKPVSEYLDDASIDAVLANCAGNGGTPQTITVPAGSFSTCAIAFDNQESQGTIWVAKAPFGVARLETLDKAQGVAVVGLLRSFR